jgi:hypothetical protein
MILYLYLAPLSSGRPSLIAPSMHSLFHSAKADVGSKVPSSHFTSKHISCASIQPPGVKFLFCGENGNHFRRKMGNFSREGLFEQPGPVPQRRGQHAKVNVIELLRPGPVWFYILDFERTIWWGAVTGYQLWHDTIFQDVTTNLAELDSEGSQNEYLVYIQRFAFWCQSPWSDFAPEACFKSSTPKIG